MENLQAVAGIFLKDSVFTLRKSKKGRQLAALLQHF
jgi:hypothetical protein